MGAWDELFYDRMSSGGLRVPKGASAPSLRVGDWVWMPGSSLGAAGPGQVMSITGNGSAPCMCCGLGVSVRPLGQPNVSMGFPASQLVKLDRPPVGAER